MEEQKFGIEIELTGLTRQKAAETIAEHFGTRANYIGGSYKEYNVVDNLGRKWKIVSDSSIMVESKNNIPAEQVEFVSPVLQYEDIETIQELIRKLRKAGAITNKSTGIHVHVGAENHTPRTLRNLVNIWTSKQNLIYKALKVENYREHYCKKLETKLSDELNRQKPDEMNKVGDIWYKGYEINRTAHYNPSRYHSLNLHSVFTKETVEFRCFNSTTHAGKIKAYIQFCLAVNYQALSLRSSSARVTTSTNEKYTFRTWLLRLGLIGDEFKTARKFLLESLEGDIAWRNGSGESEGA